MWGIRSYRGSEGSERQAARVCFQAVGDSGMQGVQVVLVGTACRLTKTSYRPPPLTKTKVLPMVSSQQGAQLCLMN